MMRYSIGETNVLHRTFGNIPYYKEVSQMLPSLRKFNQSEAAKERQRILNYHDHYGGLATFDAFGVDRKLIPYKGNPDWVEGTIKEIWQCLNSENIPKANPECEYCRYREEAKKYI